MWSAKSVSFWEMSRIIHSSLGEITWLLGEWLLEMILGDTNDGVRKESDLSEAAEHILD